MRKARILSLAVAACSAAAPLGAMATTVTLISPRTVPISTPGATLDLLAYSEFTDQMGMTSKNVVATDPVVNGASIRPLTDKVVIPKTGLVPVIGITGAAKPAARRIVNSCSSGCFSGIDGRITYIPPADATQPSMNGLLDASAAHRIERPGIGVGFSAVRGVDPDLITAGTYDLNMVITQLSLDVSSGEFGYAALFATDARFTSPLWSLEVTATSTTSPTVAFTSMPLLGLDDGAIQSRVRQDLVAGSGTLTSYTLFHALYSVPAATMYGEGLIAIAGAVPEPTMAVLWLVGLASLLPLAFARRYRANATALLWVGAGLAAPLSSALGAVVYTDGRNPQGVPDITQTGSPIANGGICAAAAAANILWNWSEFAPYDGSAGGQRLVSHPGDANWPNAFAAWDPDSISLRNALVTQIYGTGNNGYGTAGGITRQINRRGHLYDSGFFGTGLGGNADGLSVRTYNGTDATYANLYNSLYNADGSLKFAHAITNWVWHNPDGSFVNNNGSKSRHSLAVAGMDVPRNNDPGHRQIVLTNGWGSQQDRPDPVSTDYYDTYTNIVRTQAGDRLRIPAGNGDNNDGNGNDYLVHGIAASGMSDYVQMYQFIVVKKGGSPDVGLAVQHLASVNEFDYKVRNPEPTAQYHFFVELDTGVRSLLSSSQLMLPQGWAAENWNPGGTITTPETANWDGSELFAPGVATQGSAENYAFTPGWSGLHFYWTGQSGAPIGSGEIATFGFNLPGDVRYTLNKQYLTVVGEFDQTVHYYNMIGGPMLAPVPELPAAWMLPLGAGVLGWALRWARRRPTAG